MLGEGASGPAPVEAGGCDMGDDALEELSEGSVSQSARGATSGVCI